MKYIMIGGIDRDLEWQNVCYPHAHFGHIDVFSEYAKRGEYPLFCWNGRIYITSSRKDTGYLLEDVV